MDDAGLATERLRALKGVIFPVGHPHKRFVREIIPGRPLTPRQARHIERLAWRYRRQMPPHLVPPANPDAGDRRK